MVKKPYVFKNFSTSVDIPWEEKVQGDEEPSNNLPKSPFHVLPKDIFSASDSETEF